MFLTAGIFNRMNFYYTVWEVVFVTEPRLNSQVGHCTKVNTKVAAIF